jgi:hypothetical protein
MKTLNYLMAPLLWLSTHAVAADPAGAATAPPAAQAYAAVRTGKAKPGMAAELASRVQAGAVPIVRSVPGFVAYYVVHGQDDTITTVSIYRDRVGAEEANQRMLPWIRANMGDLLVSPPTGLEGAVIVQAMP